MTLLIRSSKVMYFGFRRWTTPVFSMTKLSSVFFARSAWHQLMYIWTDDYWACLKTSCAKPRWSCWCEGLVLWSGAFSRACWCWQSLVGGHEKLLPNVRRSVSRCCSHASCILQGIWARFWCNAIGNLLSRFLVSLSLDNSSHRNKVGLLIAANMSPGHSLSAYRQYCRSTSQLIQKHT